MHRVEVRRRWPLPRRGAWILVANHQSFYDGQLVACFARRQVSFLVSAPYLDAPLLGALLREVGCIPIRRTGGPEAYRASLEVLDQGCVLGVFPEAHRTRDGELQRLQPGALRLALTRGVPIQPVSILGAHDAWPPGRLLPRPGRPLVLSFHRPIQVPKAERAELRPRASELEHRVRRVLERRLAAWRRLRERQAKRS